MKPVFVVQIQNLLLRGRGIVMPRNSLMDESAHRAYSKPLEQHAQGNTPADKGCGVCEFAQVAEFLY
jgi:hypothetical protein